MLKIKLFFLILLYQLVNIKPVRANNIIINLETHQLVYINSEKNQFVEYPIVAPKYQNRIYYDNKSKFDVIDIQYKPRQLTSSGRILSYYDSFNILGLFNIPFHKHSSSERYCSIHGNAKIKDLGKNLSGCCIRMLNSDINDLVLNFLDKETKILILK